MASSFPETNKEIFTPKQWSAVMFPTVYTFTSTSTMLKLPAGGCWRGSALQSDRRISITAHHLHNSLKVYEEK